MVHCRRGYRPKGLCDKCLEDKLYLTSRVLELATALGIIELDSWEWFHLFQNRVGGKLNSRAQIITVECQRLKKSSLQR